MPTSLAEELFDTLVDRRRESLRPRWPEVPVCEPPGIPETQGTLEPPANPGRANPEVAGGSRATPTDDQPDATASQPRAPALHV